MDIIAITLCVNYDDILKHMLVQNSKFFKAWYIVTSPEDTKTVQLLKESGISHLRPLIYNDFYKEGSKFNFGGARRFAQDYIAIHHAGANILILDADIYLPNNFRQRIPKTLAPDTLYGTIERLDYWTLKDFQQNVNPHTYENGGSWCGFFQLYKDGAYRYKDSYNCAGADEEFRDLFPHRARLHLSVRHLGMETVNHDGRVSESL
jgi:hypothetical protein